MIFWHVEVWGALLPWAPISPWWLYHRAILAPWTNGQCPWKGPLDVTRRMLPGVSIGFFPVLIVTWLPFPLLFSNSQILYWQPLRETFWAAQHRFPLWYLSPQSAFQERIVCGRHGAPAGCCRNGKGGPDVSSLNEQTGWKIFFMLNFKYSFSSLVPQGFTEHWLSKNKKSCTRCCGRPRAQPRSLNRW